METVTDFIFLGSKITADGDRSHEIKRRLLLGRKAVTNLGSTLKKLALVPSLHGKQMEKQWKQWHILSSSAPKFVKTVTAAMKLEDTCSLEEKL